MRDDNRVLADMTEAWEELFRLRATPPINEDAAARGRETEARLLRELQRMSLIAAAAYDPSKDEAFAVRKRAVAMTAAEIMEREG